MCWSVGLRGSAAVVYIYPLPSQDMEVIVGHMLFVVKHHHQVQ